MVGFILGISIAFLTTVLYNFIKEKLKKTTIAIEKKKEEDKFKKQLNNILSYNEEKALKKREV